MFTKVFGSGELKWNKNAGIHLSLQNHKKQMKKKWIHNKTHYTIQTSKEKKTKNRKQLEKNGHVLNNHKIASFLIPMNFKVGTVWMTKCLAQFNVVDKHANRANVFEYCQL